MGHEAFVEVVVRHGGRFGQVDGAGGVIVVGELTGRWPRRPGPGGSAEDDGGVLARSAGRCAADRRSEFFAALGLEQYQDEARQLFSMATLTHLLDVSRE